MTGYPNDQNTADAATPAWVTYGKNTALYVDAATVVKASPGVVCQVVVLVAGAAGAIYDGTNTTGDAVTANEVAVIPATVGPFLLNFPCLAGIVVAPGVGQVVSVSYV